MKLITISTTFDTTSIELKQWIHQAEKLHYDYKILGLGEKWEGFSTKCKLVLEYCKSALPNEIVCVVDCWDLLMLQTPDILVKKFLTFESDIVSGAETRCGFNCTKATCIDEFSQKVSKYNPNGGFVMGYVSNLIELYSFILNYSPEDDQVGLGMYRNAYCNKLTLDTKSSLVLNINAVSQYRRTVQLNEKDHTLTYLPTNEKPCALHMPFQMSDFGIRFYKFRSFICGEFENPYHFKHWTSFFVKHCYKNYRLNSTLRRMTNISISVICIFIVSILALVVYRKLKIN